jgi:hypothetical protein
MNKLIVMKVLLVVIFIALTSHLSAEKYTGLTATASSGTASAAVDNNMGTRWESVHGVDPQWIVVDLGEEKTVGAIKLSWEGANAKDYSISFSVNGTDYFDQRFYTNMAGGNRIDDISNLFISCRYIKVNGTARNLTYGYSIWEFEVFSPEDPVLTSLSISGGDVIVYSGQKVSLNIAGFDQFNNPFDLINQTFFSVNGSGATIDNNGNFISNQKGYYTITATNSGVSKTTSVEVLPSKGNLTTLPGVSATASSIYNNNVPIQAVDNNQGTNWEAVYQSDPQWITVDLGSVMEISDFRIVWGLANAKDYTIDVSDDGLTWSTVVTKTNMPSNNRIDRIYDVDCNARYVKITGTSRTNNTYGYVIWEFQIFGSNKQYFLSKNSGNWNSLNNWEYSTDNVTWNAAETLPSNVNRSITISSGQEMIITDNRTAYDLTVNPNGKITVQSGKNLNAKTLTLQSDATGTATFVDNGTTNITTATVQQYLTSGRNWYISSPVDAATTGSLSSATSVVSYNEPTASWITETGNTLNPLKGYISAATTADGAVTFSGTLNTGNKSIELTRTPNVAKSGFNLVGNPYPSYLNWDLASAASTNLQTTIWFRTKTVGASSVYTFDTYNATSAVGTNNNLNGAVTKYIPPMQAFWVRVAEGKTSGTLSLNNSMRSHNDITTNKFRAPGQSKTEQQVLRLQVSNGENADETIVLFNENASNDFDDYDSQKMSNGNASIPEIFTLSGNQQLVINGLGNVIADTELPLGFTTGESNTFSIKAIEMKNFDSGMQIILKDKLLKSESDLTTGAGYTFNSEVADTQDRFSLLFKASSITTDSESHEKQYISIYRNENNRIVISINGAIENGSSVSVCNALGQKLLSEKISGSKTILNTLSDTGVYIVCVQHKNRITKSKIILK